MNIGFDFDKVLIDYPPLVPNWVIDRFYKEKDNGVLLYRIPGKFEQMLRSLIHLPPLRQPIKKNLQAIHTLSQENKYNLYIISSRFGFLKNQTSRLTKKLHLHKVFKEMHFNFDNEQPHMFKDRIIKKLHIEKYIDDDLSLVKYLAKNNPTTTFFWLNSKDHKQLAKNIFAVTNISDILQ